jgi:hypothetical protein
MLENPGFELGYRPLTAPDGSKPHHVAFVYEVDVTGGPITKRYTVERGEIHNPVGWWSWYAHQRNDETPVPWDQNNTIGWAEPEVRLSEPEHNRHRSGARAGYLFTWRRIHEGGLFQQVPVQAGKVYRFTAFAHAWISNDDTQPPTCSLPGCGPLWWKAGTPGLNDDQRSVRLSVGIDPTGGIDPYASTVVWGDEWHIFNGYRDVPLTVEAVAESSSVTVFLRSSTLWPVIHNDVAWDDCALEVVDIPLPPEPCRGLPRVQYARRVNVLPPTMSLERASAIFAACWHDGRQTVGGSYDDAGIGDLDERTAVLWDIPQADEQTFVDWYAEHYPGVKVEFAGDAGELPGMAVYSQRDPRWKDERLGASTLTIGDSGCAMVAACMLATLVEPTLTPLELNRRLSASGGYTPTGLLYWGKVESVVTGLRFLDYTTWRTTPKPDADIEQIRTALLVAPCPIQVDFNPLDADLDSHFVLALRMLEDDIEIADPWHGDVTTVRARYWRGSLAQSIFALAEYSTDDTPPEPEPPENEGQLLGLHFQSIEPGSLEFLSGAGPNVTKIVADQGAIMPVNAASPGSFVVYRHHLTREDELACLADPVNRARWFIDQFEAQIKPLVDAAYVDYVETAINETMDGDKVEAAITFEHAFIDELARRMPEALPLVATIAVGNPHESQFPLLVPLASHVIQHGGAFGYHAYWPVDHGRSYLIEQWQWHAGRFEAMDAVIRDALGYGVPWILSECGACGWNAATNAYDPAAGWKHPACFNGDWPAYKADLLKFVGLLKASPARVRGATLFTVCPPSWEWQHFTLDAAQLAELADALEA